MATDTMTMRKGRLFSIAAAFLTLVPSAWAQRYSEWRTYRASDGMAESACVSVTVGVNEKVLAKHINAGSVSELNGYSIASFAADGGLRGAQRYPPAAAEDQAPGCFRNPWPKNPPRGRAWA